MMFSTLAIAAIYLAGTVSSSPILLKRAYSNMQSWPSLDNCLQFGVKNTEEKSQMIELEYTRYFKQLADPKQLKHKTWKIPDGPAEFVELRCRSAVNLEALDWYLGLTNPQWHIEVQSSVVDEILLSATLDETAESIPKNKPQDLSIVDEKLHTARKQMLQLQEHPRKLLERFMNTPPSSFYPQSIFDKEALFRGPSTDKYHLLPPPNFDGSTDLKMTKQRDWKEKVRKGSDYYKLMDQRLGIYDTKAKELRLHEDELDDDERAKLHCYEDRVWLYTQKKKAYERLWLGTTRGGSVNHAKHLLNVEKKQNKMEKSLDDLENWKLRSTGANRVIDISFTQDDREAV